MKIKEAEQLIVKLKGVMSCRIKMDKKDNIEEIHVLSNTLREPKQISRDVQSTLTSEYGIDVDYKKISIAQIDEEIASGNDFRLKFSTVEYSISGRRATIKVMLHKDGKYYQGEATGVQTSYNSDKLIASATLNAVENFLGIEDMFIAEDVRIITMADREVVVTGIIFLNEIEEQFFTGCANVNRDKKEAIVKSTLDSINRKIMKYSNEN